MLTRRTLMKLMAASVPAMRVPGAFIAQTAQAAQAAQGQMRMPAIAPGPFAGTRASLAAYRVPEWFGEAKFGIWAHWGPQSAPEYGDWYARNMYIQGHKQYNYHVQKYGHPSKFGSKD